MSEGGDEWRREPEARQLTVVVDLLCLILDILSPSLHQQLCSLTQHLQH